ncbi:MAG TPA: sulfur carrier protein ThiS [Rugosibacter sp.]
MEVIINGETLMLPTSLSVAVLLDLRNLTGKRVAVERNGVIVPKSRHAETLLTTGDRIEIVVAVGGG